MSEEDPTIPNADPDPVPEENPMKDIRAVLPRTFTRDDLSWATKKAKQAADLKGEPITWAVAKQRAYGYFKACCGAPPYDKTVIFAPPVLKIDPKKAKKKKKAGTWWNVTMKTNRERTKIRQARADIIAKMDESQRIAREAGATPDGED